jgi:hypothetical protein
MNTSVVEDPHWIYPGEVLHLSGSEAVASVPAQDTPAPFADSASAPAPQADQPQAVADQPPAPMADEAAESPASGTDASEPTPASLASLTKVDPDAEQSAPLFGRRSGDTMQETLAAYTNQPSRARRRSEFYSSGFLTERQKLPFGEVLGPITPPQIRAMARNTNAMPNSVIAIEPPKGASYQVGDSLLLVQIGREIDNYGEVVLPSGIAQVIDTAAGKYLASVIAVYGPIRGGQRVLPLRWPTACGRGCWAARAARTSRPRRWSCSSTRAGTTACRRATCSRSGASRVA